MKISLEFKLSRQNIFSLASKASLSMVLFFTPHLKAHQNCLEDFRTSQRTLAHFLTPLQIKTLEDLSTSENPGEGWRLLGTWGDHYARIAANVLNPKFRIPESFYRHLIRRHWQNTLKTKNIENTFRSFANQHFNQYVEILQTGFFPDSDQILMSYLQTARDHHLPDLIVFDAAYDRAGLNNIRSWQHLNQIEEQRIVFPTNACIHINHLQAKKVIALDFLKISI